MEAPSVPVSHYKSGVTQSTGDNRPPPSNETAQAPPACKKQPSTSHSLAHSLNSQLREQRAEGAQAASRLPQIIPPPSHKVSIVYSRDGVCVGGIQLEMINQSTSVCIFAFSSLPYTAIL